MILKLEIRQLEMLGSGSPRLCSVQLSAAAALPAGCPGTSELPESGGLKEEAATRPSLQQAEARVLPAAARSGNGCLRAPPTRGRGCSMPPERSLELELLWFSAASTVKECHLVLQALTSVTSHFEIRFYSKQRQPTPNKVV